MIRLPRLYGIADAGFGDPVPIAAALFRGGARLVQLRNKHASSGLLLRQARAIQGAVPVGGSLIVNDRADVAQLAGAAGVHLGQDDLPPWAARKTLSLHALIGRSTHNLAQAQESDLEPIDYVAVGPVFNTLTKQNPNEPIGLDGLTQICQRLERPVVAIGGIRLEQASDVLKAGAAAVAVIRDLIDCQDIERRTREFVERLDGV